MNVATAAAAAVMVTTMLSSASRSFARSESPRTRSEMLVSTLWLQEHLTDPDLVILYVGRSRSEYDAGHIPGARFLPLDQLVEQQKDSLNDLPPVQALQALFESLGVGDDTQIVLCDESSGLLAARAYFTLDYLGHGDRAALLGGGMEKWLAEGRSTEVQLAHPAVAQFTPHVLSDVLITTSRMREMSRELESGSSDGYVLLDARPPQEFDGAVMSEAVPKVGHIPGAKSLYWKTLLQPGAFPSLLDSDELEQAFVDVGVDDEKLVVTYCRTGMQSSFTYFTAKYLGYRAAMYDGSVYEWVNRAGYELTISTPVASAIPARK